MCIRDSPYWGERLVHWIWGGFSINYGTLIRFFMLHFLLPFVLLGLVLGHLMSLHVRGSRNPLGVNSNSDKLPFHPYFSVKDAVGWVLLVLIFAALILFSPWALGDPENFLLANSLVTPVHIKPEWYFLFAYAILRSIPNKLGGVLGLAIAIIILGFLPLNRAKFKPCSVSVWQKSTFWGLVAVFIILTWIGGNPVEYPYVEIGQAIRCVYFTYYLAMLSA